jgi:hypothetical protein
VNVFLVVDKSTWLFRMTNTYAVSWLKGSRAGSLLQAVAQRGPADDIAFDPPRASIDSRGVDLG